MRKIMFIIVLVLNGVILINACKKEKEFEEVEYDAQTSQDNSLAEGTFDDINNIAAQAMENDSLSSYRMSGQQNTLLSTCATVTNTPTGNGAGTIIVDFGTQKCKCLDQRYRTGMININYSGAFRDSGSVITTSFENYFVGRDSTRMFEVTGLKSITNNGLNSEGNLSFTISANGHLINKDGISMAWSSVRNREWISGAATPHYWADDEYIITGNASGTNFEGNSYIVSITQGLHIKNCRFITKGVFELTPDGKPTRTFDYGNGECDDEATLTVNGKVIPITLR